MQEDPPGLCLTHGGQVGQEEVHGGGARGKDPRNRRTGENRQGGSHEDALIWNEGN